MICIFALREHFANTRNMHLSSAVRDLIGPAPQTPVRQQDGNYAQIVKKTQVKKTPVKKPPSDDEPSVTAEKQSLNVDSFPALGKLSTKSASPSSGDARKQLSTSWSTVVVRKPPASIDQPKLQPKSFDSRHAKPLVPRAETINGMDCLLYADNPQKGGGNYTKNRMAFILYLPKDAIRFSVNKAVRKFLFDCLIRKASVSKGEMTFNDKTWIPPSWEVSQKGETGTKRAYVFYFRNSEPDGQNAIFLIFDIRTVNHKVMMQSFTDLCEFVRGMYDHYEATLPVVPEDDEQPDVPVEPAVPETPVSKEPEPVASASGGVSGWAPGDVDWSKMVVDDSDDDSDDENAIDDSGGFTQVTTKKSLYAPMKPIIPVASAKTDTSEGTVKANSFDVLTVDDMNSSSDSE